MSYNKVADQTREMKEATFLKKVLQKEQKSKHICWCVAPCDLYNIWHIDIDIYTNNIIWWTRKPLRLVCFILRQADLGDDPCSTDQKLTILKEQDEAFAAYKVSQCIGLIHIEHSVPLSTEFSCFLYEFQLKYSGESVASSRSSTKLSSRRVLRHVGQVHESVTLEYLNKLAFFLLKSCF